MFSSHAAQGDAETEIGILLSLCLKKLAVHAWKEGREITEVRKKMEAEINEKKLLRNVFGSTPRRRRRCGTRFLNRNLHGKKIHIYDGFFRNAAGIEG
jgi:hypothetical protein